MHFIIPALSTLASLLYASLVCIDPARAEETVYDAGLLPPSRHKDLN
jgi:hypothetical protein